MVIAHDDLVCVVGGATATGVDASEDDFCLGASMGGFADGDGWDVMAEAVEFGYEAACSGDVDGAGAVGGEGGAVW